jgi:RNA polymerase primary sigma factor
MNKRSAKHGSDAAPRAREPVDEVEREDFLPDRPTDEEAPPEMTDEEDLLQAVGPGEPLDDSVRQWLREAGRAPLLSHGEELVLGRRIAVGMRAQHSLRDPQRHLTEEQSVALQRRVQQGIEAREKMACANLRLVVSVAKKYLGKGLPLDDLIQEGNIGLLRAVEKFDFRSGFRFSTYATWWIRQNITRAIADQSRTIRVPVHMVENINRVTRARSMMTQRLGREPTVEELAAELGVDVEHVREASSAVADTVSLDGGLGENEDGCLADFLHDSESLSPMDIAGRTAVRDSLEALMRQSLSDKERLVLSLRYGFLDGRPRTLDEIGAALNVTRERIRQIEVRALRRLRQKGYSDSWMDILTET